MVLGVLCFFCLTFIVPVVWAVAVPVDTTMLARWLYLLTVAVVCSYVISLSDHSDSRRRTFIVAIMVLATAVVLFGGASFAVDKVLAGFDVQEVMDAVPSPSGRLTLVQEYSDSGALGLGSPTVSVRGPLIPGLLSWDYQLSMSDDQQSVRWINDGQVAVGGRVYQIPLPIVWVGW